MTRPNDLAGGSRPEVELSFEGETLSARADEPLMATLLAHGRDIASRSVKYHRPRGAFCMTGTCGQCWMRIDDRPNRAACLTRVEAGMTATRENAFPSADHDLFRMSDWVFKGGLDHHRLGTTPVGAVNRVVAKTARQMAGLGTLSATAAEPAPAMAKATADVVIIGGGVAGSACATALAAAGRTVLILESRSETGGALDSGIYGPAPAPVAGVSTWTRSMALGFYESGQLLVRRAEPDRLEILEATSWVLATGAYEQAPLFDNSDLPGIYGVHALSRLVFKHGVLPGRRVVIFDPAGEDEGAERLFEALRARDVTVEKVCGATVRSAIGGQRLKAVSYETEAGLKRVPADVAVFASAPAPAYELASQLGCELRFVPEEGFRAAVDESGQTSVKGVFAAGALVGARTIDEARTSGERAARGLA